jgi:hypothetical protein
MAACHAVVRQDNLCAVFHACDVSLLVAGIDQAATATVCKPGSNTCAPTKWADALFETSSNLEQQW